MIMQRGEHLTIEGIQKIVNIRASLNKGRLPVPLPAKASSKNRFP